MKPSAKLGAILALSIEFIYFTLSIPTAVAPLYIYYSADAMREAQRPAGFPSNCSVGVNADWTTKVNAIKWVAYGSPSTVGDYQQKIETIFADLTVLKKAGFTGLVTYGSSGLMGKEFLTMAQSLGFEGVIMGIWNPASSIELKNAVNASTLPIVLGYSIGNEGLYGNDARYSTTELCAAIANLRSLAGKPVSTSEEIDDYAFHTELLFAGDWLFPNAHPYWHGTSRPLEAVQWETTRYADMVAATGRFVLFKEVGLPSSGAPGLSEANHDLYYRELAKTDVHFVYFEGFDRPAKNSSAVEAYWGIFDADRAPKLLGWNLMGLHAFTSDAIYDGTVTECANKPGTGCRMDSAAATLVVGDEASNLQSRGILSFNTSLLPHDAIITSMRIKIRLDGNAGMDPYSKRRKLNVEACSAFGTSVKLQPADYQAGTNCVDAGYFTDKLDANWFAADLNAVAFALVDKAGTTQFRLWYDAITSRDGKPDFVSIFSGDSDPRNRPVLVLRYTIP